MAVSSTTPGPAHGRFQTWRGTRVPSYVEEKRRAHVPDPHLRVPDELPRLRAPGGPAGRGRLPAGPGRRHPRGRGSPKPRPAGEPPQTAGQEPRPTPGE